MLKFAISEICYQVVIKLEDEYKTYPLILKVLYDQEKHSPFPG